LIAFNWMLIGILAVALALGLTFTGLEIEPRGALVPASAAATCIAAALASARLGHGAGMAGFAVAAQFVIVTALVTPLTYVAAAAGLPLQDANLALADAVFGLDWSGYLHFVAKLPRLPDVFAGAYAMISWSLIALPLLLSWGRHHVHMHLFTLALILTLVAVTAVSALVPALGAYQQFGVDLADHAHIAAPGYLDTLRDLPRVRDGSLRMLDMTNLVGIVTFPSFHAAAAVLYLWGYWPVRWLRPAAVVTNGAMLFAAPIGGGHYFVDILAGMTVAIMGIAAASVIARRVMGLGPRPARTAAFGAGVPAGPA
jgi:hypothetical protein